MRLFSDSYTCGHSIELSLDAVPRLNCPFCGEYTFSYRLLVDREVDADRKLQILSVINPPAFLFPSDEHLPSSGYSPL